MKGKVYVKLARLLVAIDNCKRSLAAQFVNPRPLRWAEDADHWTRTIETHKASIAAIVREHCPNSSNVDQLTALDMERSRPDYLRFVYPVHMMDPNGYWAGWRDYVVSVRPSLAFGINLSVQGRDYNGNKEAIRQAWDSAMEATI
jgi:hypothetical protein